MIETENLTRKFGDKEAVSDLTLTIPRGELFAFLGANGAGKTTTIKMLTGLLRPTSGTARICGCDIVKQPVEAKSRISYVPDQPYLYEKLTGREFLAFVGRMYRISRGELTARIGELAEMFELSEFLDELCETYSHGMRQRVVLCAALVHKPEVMITDEPMVALDPKTARVVKNVLRKMANDGATVFMSTHTLAVAEELADRIGIIHRGKLIAQGTLSELQRASRTTSRLEDAFLELTAEQEESVQAARREEERLETGRDRRP